jgi:hypothetical protein
MHSCVPAVAKRYTGRTVACLKGARCAGRENERMNFTVPICLMVLCIVLSALIYWGGFEEERRARKG